MFQRLVIVLCASFGVCAAQVNAQQTPVPGGANQLNGTSVKYPATAFNGTVRLKPVYFGAPRATDKTQSFMQFVPTEKRVWVFEGIVSNGAAALYIDFPDIVLADKDGITADNQVQYGIGDASGGLVQAAAVRMVRFYIAPPDFVPDHILYACRATKCKSTMRIILPEQPPSPTPS